MGVKGKGSDTMTDEVPTLSGEGSDSLREIPSALNPRTFNVNLRRFNFKLNL